MPSLRSCFYAFILLFASLCAHSGTFMKMDGISFTYGEWGEDTLRRGFRIAPRWYWDWKWPENNRYIQLTAYGEAGVGNWRAAKTKDKQNSELWIVSGSPMLQFWPGGSTLHQVKPFFELGVGPAYLSDDDMGTKHLGSNWHFEDKFGAGLQFDTDLPVQFLYRYYHYSNAGLSRPNGGLDIHTVAFVVLF